MTILNLRVFGNVFFKPYENLNVIIKCRKSGNFCVRAQFSLVMPNIFSSPGHLGGQLLFINNYYYLFNNYYSIHRIYVFSYLYN